MCQSEMANISVGEEKMYHQRRLQEMNRKIAEIIKILDPKSYEEMEARRRNAGAAAPDNGGSASAGSASDSSASSTPVEGGVEHWFKNAPKHSFKDVSGMEEVKEQLKSCIEDSKLFELRKYLGLPNLYSYFFIGPPGCGKTYIIEAFAHELMDKNYKYLSLTGSDILSKYVGEAEKIVTRLFEEAEKNAPCIVFIDEIDGVCKNRSLPNLPEYASSITTAFLTGYNKINSSDDKEIIFIGATNYPNQVDNAMLDRVELIRVPMPDAGARAFAFKQKLGKQMKLSDDFSWEKMAELTDGYPYNYRDINRLVIRIKIILMKRLMEMYHDQKKAVEALKSGEFRLNRMMFEQAQKECLPTPKEDILRDLDEWEEKFRRGMDE